MRDELYCKLFINSDLPAEELYEICRDFLQGETVQILSLSAKYLELDLRKNSDYDKDNPDDFLFWKYYADIESKTDDKEMYVDCIRSLIIFLENKEIFTIAACDFAEELKERDHKN